MAEDEDKGNEKTRQHGAAQGTREREERITGAVGVQNKKGEYVDQGSTTSPKGGVGTGHASQGRTSRSYLGGPHAQGGQASGSLGGEQGRIRDKEAPRDTTVGQGSRAGGQDAKAQARPFARRDEDEND